MGTNIYVILVCTLGSGITFATFQIDGSFISLKEELMILLTGYASIFQ